LLLPDVNYMMRVKDLAFIAPLQVSIYELASNKETPCCGTLWTSVPLTVADLDRAANLSRIPLSIYSGAGPPAGQ